MVGELSTLLAQGRHLLEAEDFAALNELVSAESLSHTTEPALYHLKCIALEQLNEAPQELLHLAQSGLALVQDSPLFLRYVYISQMRLECYAQAVLTSGSLCRLEPAEAEFHFWHADALVKVDAHAQARCAQALGHLQRAFALLECGEHEQALVSANRACELDGNLKRAMLLHAEIELHMGRHEAAGKKLNAVLDDPELRIDALEMLAKIADKSAQMKDLRRYCDALLALDPEHAYALRSRAKCAQRAGDLSDVFAVLDEACTVHVDDIWCHLARFAYAGRMAQDETFLLTSQNIVSLPRLIEVFVDSGLYEAAASKLAHFPVDDPAYPALLEKVAWTLFRYRQFGVMRQILENALTRIPARAGLYGLLAGAVGAVHVEEGRALIPRGTAIDAQDPTLAYFNVMLNVHYYLFEQLRPLPVELAGELQTKLDLWLASHAQEGDALFYSAAILISKQAYAPARRLLERAVGEDLVDTDILYWRARLALLCGCPEEAWDFFTQKFEKRTMKDAQRFEHFLLKADIAAQAGWQERLADTLVYIKRTWAERIGPAFDAMQSQWQRQLSQHDGQADGARA